MTMSREQRHEMQQLIRETVMETVPTVIESVLQKFGFDTENVTETQQDIAFSRKFRRGAESAKSALITTCFGALATGFIALLVMGLRSWFKNGGNIP